MEMLVSEVNWVAVFPGFISSFLLGWLWYSPKMFGRQWAEGVGVALSDGSQLPAVAMVTQALGTFGLAWLFGIAVAQDALLFMLVAMATLMLLIVSNGKYVQKTNTAVAIEAAYILVMGLLMLLFQALL